jgi:hypothetical protein
MVVSSQIAPALLGGCRHTVPGVTGVGQRIGWPDLGFLPATGHYGWQIRSRLDHGPGGGGVGRSTPSRVCRRDPAGDGSGKQPANGSYPVHPISFCTRPLHPP